jgi:hypothetical protein
MLPWTTVKVCSQQFTNCYLLQIHAQIGAASMDFIGPKVVRERCSSLRLSFHLAFHAFHFSGSS